MLPNPGYYDIIYNGTRDDDQKEDRDQIWQYYKDLNFLSGLSKEEAEDMANKTIEAETVLAQWQVDEPWDDSDDAVSCVSCLSQTRLRAERFRKLMLRVPACRMFLRPCPAAVCAILHKRAPTRPHAHTPTHQCMHAFAACMPALCTLAH